MKKLTFLSRCSLLTIAVAFIAMFVSCSRTRTVEITIMHTSDIHGSFFPYDFIEDKPADGSLARIYTLIKQTRAQNKNTVLLDNGDVLQGQPCVYYYNFIDTTTTHLAARIYNYIKYDAAGVGNHDIETGHAVYDKVFAEYNFPVLAANAVRVSDGEPYFKPYTIIKRDGIKIAVLGMITPGIPKWLPNKIWSGIEFKDMIETAQKWIPIIQQKESPDLILGLFHSGYDSNREGETESTPRNENASLLVAQKVAGFDAIFIGHDHDRFCQKIVNTQGDSVVVVDVQNAGKLLSQVTFNLTKKGEKIIKKQVSAKLLDTKNIEPDSAFIATFQTDFNNVKNFVSRPIGEFTESISTREAYFGASKFIDLIHRIQLDITNADVSITAPLSFDTQISKGKIYVRDMFKLYKYENLLYTMSLTGREIKDVLEFSYGLWVNQMKTQADDILLFRESENNRNGKLLNPYYNFDAAAGIVYTVDVTKPAGERVNIEKMNNGEAFDMNKTYSVAINSYRGNGGGGHLTLGAKIDKDQLPKRITFSTDRDLRFYLMQWIESKKNITPAFILNADEWKFIPAALAKPAIEKDYKLMFDK